MHAGYDDDTGVVDPVEQAVGKALDKEPTGIAVDYRIDVGKGEHRGDGCVDGGDELVTQSGTLSLVPVESGPDVVEGRREEAGLLHT